jgi:hypothetical protein
MTDYILGSEGQKVSVTNRFNPGGIEATLKRWYESYKLGEISEHDAGYSIKFDGVMVWRQWDNFSENEATRFIGSITDLASVFDESKNQSASARVAPR